MSRRSCRHQRLKLIRNSSLETALKTSPIESEYLRAALNPENWTKQLAKISCFEQVEQNWAEDTAKKIKAPALIIAGDADIIVPEHPVPLRLPGGGSLGELGMPASQLAILTGTMHSGHTQKSGLLLPMIFNFLENAT